MNLTVPASFLNYHLGSEYVVAFPKPLTLISNGWITMMQSGWLIDDGGRSRWHSGGGSGSGG